MFYSGKECLYGHLSNYSAYFCSIQVPNFKFSEEQ
jgi:hypothetical protein